MEWQKVIRLVRQAGEILLDRASARQVTVKGRADYVTQVDLAVQRFLKQELAALTPDIPLLSEEQDNSRLDFSRPLWVLDPVDGTTNLIHGFPASAVSLGLLEGEEVTLGVVYNPFSRELFTAKAGAGAFLGDDPIRVREGQDLEHSLIAVGTSPYHKERTEENFALFARVFSQCEDIRRTGSAALDLCQVACGRLDGYLERGLKPWDYAGGWVILREAGGRITDYQNRPVSFAQSSDCLAGSPRIHAQLLELVRGDNP